MITLFEELQSRVAAIIGKNKELAEELEMLYVENRSLQEKVTQLETSLMKEVRAKAALHEEKDALRISIDGLLRSIDTINGR